MSTNIKIFFDKPLGFNTQNFKPLVGIVGLYFIFTSDIHVQYPFKQSRLLYIGMSEKKTNSIGNRLNNHLDGNSNNFGLVNYRKVGNLLFTYIDFEMLRKFWNFNIEELESYFILDFVEKYGVYPICNNKAGYEILEKMIEPKIIIDWSSFD